MRKQIYIASSWKNVHAVELLTAQLRDMGFIVISWVENSYNENPKSVIKNEFETWINSKDSDQSFNYDTGGAKSCDIFIYLGPAGKDAAAECGICWSAGRALMLGLTTNGEDFGLMRKMFDKWFDRTSDLFTFLLEEIGI